ncbi:MAG: DUF3499 family protein [Acidimicrobiia bacterium]
MRSTRVASRVAASGVHPAFGGVPVRRCARPDCSATGAVTLVCDYAARTVVMVAAADSPEVDDPARYDLCARHAERFRPPHGWELTVDIRDPDVHEAEPETAAPAPTVAQANAERAANAFAQLALSDVDPRELAAALG